ncbi:hypothetical protein OKC48_07275 [Methylorubrum extorquens]|uniref:hypothetical protein n=1 Tax=Methylorubrum extorquens TaxID=408 RepID=UPI002238A0E5|nr:hypothetical protein [Methylorubrum extorquens]UYW28308.1 hypothetical protein OKC48_07275 [Methylorubrum extorquens]
MFGTRKLLPLVLLAGLGALGATSAYGHGHGGHGHFRHGHGHFGHGHGHWGHGHGHWGHCHVRRRFDEFGDLVVRRVCF